MRILFLYSELADYTLACLRALKVAAPENVISVVHAPINKEAPFAFQFDGIGDFRCIDTFESFENFFRHVSNFHPQKIVCSGWNNKWYLKAVGKLKDVRDKIVCSDNQWHGTVKQHLLAVISPFTLRRIFNAMWIPGIPQWTYARKLGFAENEIITGFYSCDTDLFNAYFEKYKSIKQRSFPRRFLCVARYIPVKGYAMLWQAFSEWKSKTSNDWELWCAGTGEEFERRMRHEHIRHLGFVQGKEWEFVIQNTGVFVLPSLYEPWGVAVHEFAASGFPLMLSNQVGASHAFLKTDNGKSFVPGNLQDIINSFDFFASQPVEELLGMGTKSVGYSQVITPQRWAKTLLARQL